MNMGRSRVKSNHNSSYLPPLNLTNSSLNITTKPSLSREESVATHECMIQTDLPYENVQKGLRSCSMLRINLAAAETPLITYWKPKNSMCSTLFLLKRQSKKRALRDTVHKLLAKQKTPKKCYAECSAIYAQYAGAFLQTRAKSTIKSRSNEQISNNMKRITELTKKKSHSIKYNLGYEYCAKGFTKGGFWSNTPNVHKAYVNRDVLYK